MSASRQASASLWEMGAPVMSAQPLTANVEADVVIVGCGVAGLSAAYELMRSGRRVVAIDRKPIGAGMTGRSTAHLSFVSDDGFDDLISTRGFDIAQGWHESQAAAVDRIDQLQRELAIDCEFARVGAYLFLSSDEDRSYLDKEYDASRRLGLTVTREIGVPFHGEAETPALVYADQARVNPLKYIEGLAKAILAGGGAIHTGATVTKIVEDDDGVRVETAGGPTLRAAQVIVATNAPINDRLAVHAKQAPYRTYAMAFRLPRGALPDALYWDTADPYHYVRLQPFDAGSHVVIVGGEDHKSGEANDADQRFAALTEWTRSRLPQAAEEVARWSGQVMEPIDGIGFIGRNPGENRVYVATGDSGQGMTHGAAAGLLLRDLIVTGESPWSAVYDPSRKPLSAVSELVKENLTAVKNYAEYLGPGDVASVDALQKGQGAIIRDGLQMIAAYRDEAGQLFTRSAVCTHLGCQVHWNGFEKCWDCPCHGSQFAPDGEAINGPAVAALAPVAPRPE